jgi:hypothetical protein
MGVVQRLPQAGLSADVPGWNQEAGNTARSLWPGALIGRRHATDHFRWFAEARGGRFDGPVQIASNGSTRDA